MATALELLREGRRDEIWQKYCGFIDLSLEEFMDIQKRLLMEQIDLLSKCELGRKLLGDRVPTSVEEFQETVPLTTYEVYAPYLLEKREDVLPAKPYWWLRTSGRSGEYACKWIPYSQEMARKLAQCSMAGLIFASCFKKGEFVFEENDIMLAALAPFPYISGAIGRALEWEFNFSFVPPTEEAMKMDFPERIREGFRLALKTGLDAFNGLASVLAKIGDQFVEGPRTLQPSLYLLHPKVLARLIRGLIRARLDGRKHLLPKDLWDVKCIGTGGTDTVLFRHQIKEYWGREPVEAYACTEGGLISIQMWNCKGMTFFPDVCFLEFIPEEEHIKSKEDPTYRPRTLLLDQVEAGKRYEIVLTNFLGGAMVRYRVGDIIQIIALRDEELDINLPQMVFYSRADDIIDIASIARLTETVVWQAIADAGFKYTDWVARKEYEGGEVLLHLYIEPKGEVDVDVKEIRERIHRNLQRLDPFYAELESLWKMDPLRVTLLPPGTFQRYYEARQKEGADLAHLKPPHMNPSDRVLDMLLAVGSEEKAS
ncbi:MAG TPA: GH3 auxin-responsive promoter [Anaerolineae bacterium]|nr:GH3 auxin-responsive promoter [Anaerolineae bacterium]